jgi:glycerol uptake facilitator-like aquaporin
MREYIVEYLGTVFFLYVVLVAQAPYAPLAIGSALALSIYLGGPISGGNFNPAVTIMLALSKKQSIDLIAPYIIAQLAAAFTVVELYKRV